MWCGVFSIPDSGPRAILRALWCSVALCGRPCGKQTIYFSVLSSFLNEFPESVKCSLLCMQFHIYNMNKHSHPLIKTINNQKDVPAFLILTLNNLDWKWKLWLKLSNLAPSDKTLDENTPSYDIVCASVVPILRTAMDYKVALIPVANDIILSKSLIVLRGIISLGT